MKNLKGNFDSRPCFKTEARPLPRYGESAGEATEDAFATAGHAVGTAWNLFKIRKAVMPSSSLPGNMVKSAVRNRK